MINYGVTQWGLADSRIVTDGSPAVIYSSAVASAKALIGPGTRDDREFSFLDYEVISKIGFPSLLVARREFKIEVPDELSRGHSEFYR